MRMTVPKTRHEIGDLILPKCFFGIFPREVILFAHPDYEILFHDKSCVGDGFAIAWDEKICADDSVDELFKNLHRMIVILGGLGEGNAETMDETETRLVRVRWGGCG